MEKNENCNSSLEKVEKTKISIITYGCSLNQSDSEMMLGLLEPHYDLISDPDLADLIIVNSCTVKHLAEKKLFKTLKELKKMNKKIVVAGCVAQAHQEYLSSRLKDISVIGTRQIRNIKDVVQQTLDDFVVHAIDMDCDKRICVPVVRKNPFVGIVPLSEGCVGDCTYCKTRQARGRLTSYAPGAIVQRVRSDIQSGCKEIWLTSQDCGAYGQDIGENLPNLLKPIMEIDGDFKVRLGMANPNHIHKMMPWLLQIFKENATEQGKLFAFLHIPVQSGDNKILKAMNRRYTVEQFQEIVKEFRREIPKISIATDLIVGFPGETEEQFQNTLSLVKDMDFDVINISRFWPRPGTPAAALQNQIHGQVSKVRSEQLKLLKDQMCAKRNLIWKDWSGSIIIDEKGPTGGWIGRNFAYKPIAVPDPAKLGKKRTVKVTKTFAHHLE